MEAFPFTDEEWEPLRSLSDAMTNAILAHDDALKASLCLDMLDLVDGLRARYGDHPVLLETAADHTEDDTEAAPLYRRAVDVAEANDLPTLSIRLAYSFNLMKLGVVLAALEELRACGGEAADGSETERKEWLDNLQMVADYAEDRTEAPGLYRRAMEIAAEHGLPTLDIRLLLVRLLLDVGERTAAREELRACKGEVPDAVEDQRTWWAGDGRGVQQG